MPQKDPLNENNILNIAFALSIKVILTSLTTALSLYLNIIYKWLILIAVYYINLLVTTPNFYLVLALYLANTIYKDEALVYNYF